MRHVQWPGLIASVMAAGLWLGGAASARAQSVGDAAAPASLPANQKLDPAQSLKVDTALEERPTLKGAIDPYAAEPLRLGNILLYPSIAIGPSWTSNVNESNDDPESDIGIGIRPSLSFASDWQRHSWTGNADFNLTRYREASDAGAQSGSADTVLRLDLQRGTRAELSASYVLNQDEAGNLNSGGNGSGFQTEQDISAEAAIIQDAGPMQLRASVGATGVLYSNPDNDGPAVSSSQEDYLQPSVGLRLTYTDPPSLKPYAAFYYQPRLYRDGDSSTPDRTSDGYAAYLGMVIEKGPIWTGDIAVTYQWQDYRSGDYSEDSVLGLVGNLTWSPSDLSRIILSFGTGLDSSDTVDRGANPEWSARLGVTHELRDNVTLNASAGVNLEKMDDGNDVTVDGDLFVEWQVNRYVGWTAGYDFTWLDAAQSSQSYVENRVFAGLVLRP